MDSIEKLRAQLEDEIQMAQHALIMADYTEDTAKMFREKEAAHLRIRELKARLKELDSDNY